MVRCHMKIHPWLAGAFGLLIATSSWAEESVLRIHGSNTIGAKLAPALAQDWLRQQAFVDIKVQPLKAEELQISARHPDGRRIRIDIRSHGSGTGFQDLVAGTADIAMSSRPAKEDEAAALDALGGTLRSVDQEHVIGLDGLAIVVHPDNPLAALNVAQIRAVFAGQIRDWAQLGGTPGQIQLHARDDKSGTYDSFKSMVLEEAPLSALARRYESSDGLVAAVLADPGAIGFVGLSYAKAARMLAVSAAGTVPLQPERIHVATEDYLLSRRLFFYHRPGISAAAQQFVDHVLSQAGQERVDASGYVSQSIFNAEAQALAGMPEGYYRVVEDATRLSVNFRFRPQSATLDSRAIRDLDRLREFMQRPENRGKQLRLAGFSLPGNGSTTGMALFTANDRVDHIAALLATKGVPTRLARGFFETALVAGIDSSEGRQRNERVEVWLYDPSAG